MYREIENKKASRIFSNHAGGTIERCASRVGSKQTITSLPIAMRREP